MARIRAISQPFSTRVVIAGRLGARDMGRLEHACAPALTSARLDLVVDITQVTDIDSVAAEHLRRIAVRGAIISRRN